jgi:hypothetical protein
VGRVRELDKDIEPGVAVRQACVWPTGGRLMLALGLAMLGWAVPLAVFYLLR